MYFQVKFFFLGSYMVFLSIIWAYCILYNEAYYAASRITFVYLSDALPSTFPLYTPPFKYIDDIWQLVLMCCLVSQLCLTLCNTMDCSPPGSSVHGDSSGKNTRVSCHALLQEFFPTQGSKPGFLHCGWILHHLNHHGSPYFSSIYSILQCINDT